MKNFAEADRSPHLATLTVLCREICEARGKFPDNEKLLAALMEEVGELAQSMLQRRGRGQVKIEALQVACVALRIYEEGDSDFDCFGPTAWRRGATE